MYTYMLPMESGPMESHPWNRIHGLGTMDSKGTKRNRRESTAHTLSSQEVRKFTDNFRIERLFLMSFLETAKEVFKVESEALAQLAGQLDSNYCEAIDAILGTQGRVIVCGMGKSGIIAKKISATLASTGTPSFFMHPGEAYHGDLGMVTPDDIFIALSIATQHSNFEKVKC